MMNEYEARAILGVDHDASFVEIKRAYEFLSTAISDSFRNADTLSLVRSQQGLDRINEAWQGIESLHWLGMLGQTRLDWGPSADSYLTGTSRVSNFEECEICGAYPATSVKLAAVSTLLWRIKSVSHQGSFCRTCGTTIARTFLARTLIRGWWGLGIVIAPYLLSVNVRSWAKLRKVADPMLRDPSVLSPYDSPLPVVKNPLLDVRALASTALAAILFTSLLQGIDTGFSSSQGHYQAGGLEFNFSNIPQIALSNFQHDTQSKPAHSSIKLILDPKLDPDFATNLKENLQTFTQLFSYDLGGTSGTVVAFKSQAWAYNTITAHPPASSSAFLDHLKSEFSPTGNMGQACTEPGTSASGVSFSTYSDSPFVVVSDKCGWKSTDSDISTAEYSASVINHELTHSLQSLWTNQSPCLPAWFEEGQSNFVGSATSTLTGSAIYFHDSKNWRYKYIPNGNLAHLELETGWENVKNLDPAAYQEGALAVQYLVAKYGWSKVRQLTALSMDPNCDYLHFHPFRKSFKRIMGSTLEDFYRTVRPYLLSGLPKLLRRLNSTGKPAWMRYSIKGSNSPGLIGVYGSGISGNSCDIWEYETAAQAINAGRYSQQHNSKKFYWYKKDGMSRRGVVLLADSESLNCVILAKNALHWTATNP